MQDSLAGAEMPCKVRRLYLFPCVVSWRCAVDLMSQPHDRMTEHVGLELTASNCSMRLVVDLRAKPRCLTGTTALLHM